MFNSTLKTEIEMERRAKVPMEVSSGGSEGQIEGCPVHRLLKPLLGLAPGKDFLHNDWLTWPQQPVHVTVFLASNKLGKYTRRNCYSNGLERTLRTTFASTRPPIASYTTAAPENREKKKEIKPILFTQISAATTEM